MSHTYADLLYHVVFSTKGRAPLISGPLAERLPAYLGGIIRGLDGEPLAVSGTRDHVHLLIALPATTCVADALRVLKANSSRWANHTPGLPAGFAWQTGYGAFSVSESNREDVRSYIRAQEGHHRKMSFEDELRLLLQKHNVDFDPRFL